MQGYSRKDRATEDAYWTRASGRYFASFPDKMCLFSWGSNSKLARDMKSDTAKIPALSGQVKEITEGVGELQVTKNGELRENHLLIM